MTEDLRIFAEGVGKFLEREAVPNVDRYIQQHQVDRALWNKAGEAGLLCASMPEEYGGAGGTFAHEAAIIERSAAASTAGASAAQRHRRALHPALRPEEQKKRGCRGSRAANSSRAIAMTEPGTGSDLQGVKTTARKDGNHYVINGSKTFITNGRHGESRHRRRPRPIRPKAPKASR